MSDNEVADVEEQVNIFPFAAHTREKHVVLQHLYLNLTLTSGGGSRARQNQSKVSLVADLSTTTVRHAVEVVFPPLHPFSTHLYRYRTAECERWRRNPRI